MRHIKEVVAEVMCKIGLHNWAVDHRQDTTDTEVFVCMNCGAEKRVVVNLWTPAEVNAGALIIRDLIRRPQAQQTAIALMRDLAAARSLTCEQAARQVLRVYRNPANSENKKLGFFFPDGLSGRTAIEKLASCYRGAERKIAAVRGVPGKTTFRGRFNDAARGHSTEVNK